jgi:Ribonuclease G/E
MDVDTAGRLAVTSLDREVNLAAADEAARQISLRSLGGLVVVDFVSMKGREDRTAVAERLRTRLAGHLGRATRVLEISALGLCEAAVARRARPLRDALGAVSPAEREALDALRAIEREAPGRPSIDISVSREAEAWLNSDPIGWREILAARIGSRLNFQVEDRPPGRPTVIGRGGHD